MSRVQINSRNFPEWNTVTGSLVRVAEVTYENGAIELVGYVRPDSIAGIQVSFPLAELVQI